MDDKDVTSLMDTSHGAACTAFWEPIVNSGDAGDGPTDRPKMAEALASLREGLSETDDPLYDGWKLRKAAAASAANVAAASEAVKTEPDGTDTVPVRVVRYLVFPKWAIVVAAALAVFAAVVTVVGVGFRAKAVQPEPASTVAADSTPVADAPSTRKDQPPAGSPEASYASPRSPPSAAGVASAQARRKVKGKNVKTQDPGFFHEPGF